MEMPQSFPDWYRCAGVEVRDELVKKRWESVARVADDVSPLEVIQLARLFVRHSPLTSSLAERLIGHFQNNDSSFGPRDNAFELRVLAGCILGALLERQDASSDAAALGLGCLTLQFSRQHDTPVLDILDRASSYLRQRALALRKRAPLPSTSIPKLDFSEQLTAIEGIGGNQANLVAPPLRAIVEKLGEAFRAFAKPVVEVGRRQATFLRAQDEELNIVWWLFGGWSRDEDARFAELPLGTVCIRAGKELADLTVFPIGPFSVVAYLDHLVRASAGGAAEPKLSVADAVGATGVEWMQKWLGRKSEKWRRVVESMKETLPITFGTARSAESDKASAWIAGYEAAAAMKASEEIEATLLSSQFYHEQLLLALLEQLEQA